MTQDEKQHAKEHYGHLLAAQRAVTEFNAAGWVKVRCRHHPDDDLVRTADGRDWECAKCATSALSTQIGGDHYKKMAVQPMEYSMANGLDACQHTAIKYITRFRDKGGVEDLRKAMHVIQMLIEFEEKKNG